MEYMWLVVVHILTTFVQAKVLIVGAGVAGLSAAKTLTEAGIDVLVLEGADFIGGRSRAEIIGTMADGRPYYMHFGASWVHGQGDNPVWKLNEKYHLFNTTWVPSSYLTVFENGEYEVVYGKDGVPGVKYRSGISDYIWNSTENLRWLNGQLDAHPDHNPPVDYMKGFFVQKYLREKKLSGKDLERFRLFYDVYDDENQAAGDDVAGVLEYGLSYGNDKEMMVGYPSYNALSDFLARGIDVRLRKIVKNITWGTPGVNITTASGDVFEGEAVIITVSVGVLQAEKIAFSPSLPEWKTKTIYQGLSMGLLECILLVWDSAWWPDVGALWRATKLTQTTTGLHGTLEWYNVNQVSSMPYPALKVTPWGQIAKWMESLSDDEVIDILMKELGLILENQSGVPDPLPQPKEIHRSRHWNNDFHLGSYGFYKTDAPGAVANYLAEPIANRLFFAGEAQSTLRPGYMDGALVSGQEVGAEIIKLYESSGGKIPWVQYGDRLPLSRENEIRKKWYDDIYGVIRKSK